MTRNRVSRRAPAVVTLLLVLAASFGIYPSASAHPSRPAAPDLAITASYYDQVHLTWEPGSDDPGLTYRIHNRTLGWTLDKGSSTRAVWAIGGLDAGETHTFEVTAVDSNGEESAPSNRVSATIPALGPPTNVQAALDGDTVKLSWDRPTESAPGTSVQYLVRINGALERVTWPNRDTMQLTIPLINTGTTRHEYTVGTAGDTQRASALLTVPPSQDNSPPTTPTVKIFLDDQHFMFTKFVEESTDDATPQSQIRYEGLRFDHHAGEYVVLNYDVPIGTDTPDISAYPAYRARDEAGNRSAVKDAEWDF